MQIKKQEESIQNLQINKMLQTGAEKRTDWAEKNQKRFQKGEVGKVREPVLEIFYLAVRKKK